MTERHFEETLVENASPAGPVDSLTPGAVVAGYVIDEVVARGGFATVHKAHVERTGEIVAFKLLRPELVPAGTPARRFRTEAEALARVEHPSIVRILEAGEAAPGMPFLVMEWVEGRTLSDEIRAHGAFSADEVLGLMEQLCAALGTVHRAGIVHRDLKPSNVMVVPEGDWLRVKLLDFGIAKLIEQDTKAAERGLTTTGMMLGTPSYMAPEQLLGQRVDARADIYALGVLGFMLLTGQHPFTNRTSTEIAEMHLTAVPPRVSDILPVPPGVDEAIRKCLEKRPSGRYPSVEAFLDDLRRAARATPAQESRRKPKRLFVAIHVTAAFCGADEEMDDEAVEQIDLCLERALDSLTKAGMVIGVSTGNAFLAVREANVEGEEGAAEERATAIELALSVRREIAVSLGPTPDVYCSFAVNVSDNRAHLQEPRWMTRNPWDAVVATQDALAGVESRFVLRHVPGMPDRRVVEWVFPGTPPAGGGPA